MKKKNEWADIIYRDRLEEDKVYLHVDRMISEFRKEAIGAIEKMPIKGVRERHTGYQMALGDIICLLEKLGKEDEG